MEEKIHITFGEFINWFLFALLAGIIVGLAMW